MGKAWLRGRTRLRDGGCATAMPAPMIRVGPQPGLDQTTIKPRLMARATAWVVFSAPSLNRALSI